MKQVLVTHTSYGCDTGCCGHVVEIDGHADSRTFAFSHPYGDDHLAWAKDFVREQCGEDHVADLDWENSVVLDD
jgi:hypothetical protein